MYIEFENSIKEAIESVEFKQRLLGLVGQSAEEHCTAIMQYDFSRTVFAIDKCPKNIDADISSNVCFVLAKTLKQVINAEIIKPLQIAEIIRDMLPKDMFELSLDGETDDVPHTGNGYLNAKATKDFLKLFINKKCLSAPLMTGSEFDEIFPWKRIECSESEDMQKLMKLYREKESKGECGDEMNELKLMLLALLGNVELDVNGYLNNIYGSENLPWYIKRFGSDSQTMLDEISERFVVKDEFCGSLLASLIPRWLLPAIDVICRYRFVVKTSLESRHPERLPGLLTEIINAFYKFYNHPECRSLKASVYNYSDLHVIINTLRTMALQLGFKN